MRSQQNWSVFLSHDQLSGQRFMSIANPTMRQEFIASDKTLSACRYGKCNRRETLYEGTAGERIAVRLSSGDTNGIYAIVESVAAPGYSPPMHLHRNEEEPVEPAAIIML
jgi:hypothetical protein